MLSKGLWLTAILGHVVLAILVISGDIASALRIAICWTLVQLVGVAASLFQTRASGSWSLMLATTSILLTLFGASTLYTVLGHNTYTFVITNHTHRRIDAVWLHFQDGRTDRVDSLNPGDTRTIQVRTTAGCVDKQVFIFGDERTSSHEYTLCVEPLLGDVEHIVIVGELDVVAKHRRWYLQALGG